MAEALEKGTLPLLKDQVTQPGLTERGRKTVSPRRAVGAF